jgi:CubicO group peptidase (beta-lactamase class C family)
VKLGAALAAVPLIVWSAAAADGGRRGTPERAVLRAPAADTLTGITLLKDREGLVPLPGGMKVLSLNVVSADEAAVGLPFDAELRACGFDVEPGRISPEGLASDSLAAQVARAELVVVSAYGEPVDRPLVERLRRIESTKPMVVVLFGPALVPSFAPLGTYLVSPGLSDGDQRHAARALAGTEPILGTLGIELGPHHPGEGLRREGKPEQVGLPRTLATLPMSWNYVEVDPASAGMDKAALDRVDQVIRAALVDSAAPGAALAIGRRGKLVRLRGFGTLDWSDPRPVSAATIYDLASLTKVVATTPAAMILEGQGKLDLDAPVARYLPWFAKSDAKKARITVRQLLLHRTGFAAFRPWYRDHRGPAAYREAIAKEPLQSPPGTKYVYSDTNFMVLGFVIEAIAGEPLERFAAERVFGPLGMEDTAFRPDPELLPRVAPTELDTIFRHTHVHGVVHDENAFAMGGVAGHAGVFSTAWDLAAYADMLLNDGVAAACKPAVGSGLPCTRPRADTVRVLPAGSVARWTRRYDATSSQALGWDTPEGASSSAGVYFSDRAFGHTGFTGTSIWIDPELDLYVVLLTNRVDPSRANEKHLALRRAVADAAARAITDRDVPRRR